MVQRCLAHHVQILADLDLLRGDSIELLVLQTHTHSVVDVRPLGSVIELRAVVCEPIHEVACLFEVVEHEFFFKRPVCALVPA